MSLLMTFRKNFKIYEIYTPSVLVAFVGSD